jgi:predicted DNA-binding protein (UPF0251 family)
MNTITQRVRKSERLTESEKKAFKKWLSEQLTKIDAAEAIGVSRPTLDRIFHSGSGSTESISKIRSLIN